LRLRQKLEPDPANPRYFLTMHGTGYKFLPGDLVAVPGK
jgi:DNA-binding response OmpR family regulator